MEKGLVIGGSFSEVLVRQKCNHRLELGELLIADTPKGKVLLQVVDLFFGSQISQQNLELVSGMRLEEQTSVEFMDPHLRNYTLASLKSVLLITQKNTQTCKVLPGFFSSIKGVTQDDLHFLTQPKNPLFIGDLRSGSKVLEVPISLNGKEVLSHHVLICAATGKGKSNLTSVTIWQATQEDYCGLLVLDPHDEYYGRTQLGLKDHPQKEKVAYYTPNNPPPGSRSLSINLELIRPEHFNGVVDWTHAQRDALSMYYRQYQDQWIRSIFMEPTLQSIQEATVMVLKRKLMNILNLDVKDEELFCRGVFSTSAGKSTINDITRELEQAKTVIIDTSRFHGAQEILIGSLVATQVLRKYQYYKTTGELKNKPVISIVLEEAPRVLGKEVLEKGSNIFSTIAREGRKFQVGIIAITQLPSLIPRQILANMNTKIILGIEMKQERQAIIESSAQDLSRDDRTIASLDKGEALITSNFARFATPVKVPFYPHFVKKQQEASPQSQYPKRVFTGMHKVQ